MVRSFLDSVDEFGEILVEFGEILVEFGEILVEFREILVSKDDEVKSTMLDGGSAQMRLRRPDVLLLDITFGTEEIIAVEFAKFTSTRSADARLF